jgi:phospholipid/cholesterol/gamma-HCH transport system substrate-binding protein
VGVLVLATIIVTILLVALVNGWGPSNIFAPFGKKTIYMLFDEAPGVSIDTPIRKSGILVGRVSNIELVEKAPYAGKVLITARIDADRRILNNETPRIAAGNFLGDAIIEFIPGPTPTKPIADIQNEEFLKGTVSPNPLQAIATVEHDLRGAMASITQAGNDMGGLARNINARIENNEEQLQRIIVKAERALDSITLASDNANKVLGDDELMKKLEKALRDVPDLVNSAKTTLAEAEQALGSLRKASERAERNLANLEGITGPIGRRGEQIVANVENSVRKLDQLMDELGNFGLALNSGKGTFGQFVNNPDVYQKLDRAADNILEVSLTLRPILNDARIFMDKLARDPRQLGIKGALDKSSTGIK